MSIEENMTREDLARDAADQQRAAHEAEVMAEYKELFTGCDGDIREILREMADSPDEWFKLFMVQKRNGMPLTAGDIMAKAFDRYAMEYVERNMRDGE